MKKITLSAALIAALSSLAIAGGDIAPVEPVVEEVYVEESTGAFYLGLAYSYMNASSEATATGAILDANGNLWNVSTGATLLDESVSSAMIQAGYKFNDYVAIEGRYWFGGSTDPVLVTGLNGGLASADVDVDSWGIYVKPMYPVTEAFNIYALLGYASSSYDVNLYQGIYTASLSDGIDFDGFSWGLGADYAFGENWSVFVDYVSLYNDSTTYGAFGNIELDDQLDTWNFGVTYTF